MKNNKLDALINNDAFSVIIVLVILVIISSILSPVFFSANNLVNVLQQVIVYATLSAGLSFVIYTGGIDLSIGAILAVAGITCGYLMHMGVPIPIAIICGLATGAIIGAFNGILVAYCSLQPMIATLATQQICRGLALTITGGKTVTGFDDAFKWIGNGRLFGTVIPVTVIYMIVIYIICFYVTKYRRLGRIIYAIGGNEEAARLSGINVKKYKMSAYVISGFFAAVAGIIYTAKLNSAQGIAGEGYESDAIAAAVIGGTSLRGGRGVIWGSLLGAIVIGIIRNCMNLLNVSSYIQQIVLGIVILLAVLFDSYRTNKRSISKKK